MDHEIRKGPKMSTSTGDVQVSLVLYDGIRVGVIKTTNVNDVTEIKTIRHHGTGGGSHSVSGYHPNWLIEQHIKGYN